MKRHAIIVENLSKKFIPFVVYDLRSLFSRARKVPVVALDDVSFTLEEGCLLGLVGPNGSGKTTLIRILAGIILPDQGRAFINGFDVVSDGARAKSAIGVVLGENRSFYPRLTGRQNLEVFASFQNIPAQSISKKIDELSDLFKIQEYLEVSFQEYSSGIKQRFALIRGLMNNAPILLLDEPTKNLDPVIAKDFLSFVKHGLIARKNKTVILATHILSEISDVADDIVILVQGKIKAKGPLKELNNSLDLENADFNTVYAHYVK